METNAQPPVSPLPSKQSRRKTQRSITRVQNAMLPQGENFPAPRSGLLYFNFRGKVKNIRSLDLFYDGPMGKSTLKLLP